MEFSRCFHGGSTAASNRVDDQTPQLVGDRNSGSKDIQSSLLRSQLDERAYEIERLKSQRDQLQNDVDKTVAALKSVSQEADGTKRELQLAEADLQTSQRDLRAAREAHTQDVARLETLEDRLKAADMTVQSAEEQIARGRDLLDHDRDIRDLMGSRDLYIAEVYDVAKSGTEKPFGRVFYTRGKSLIFYAYDLDQQQGIRMASIFQAWGGRGPDRDRAVNLGIFFQDNLNKKRWIVKSDNPKTLAQIDAVFVTVEPSGGSPHPSSKPLLFTYLRLDANHP